ncbi:MAG: hypothetical protein ACRDNY_08110 [Gaiellaceae bacterium]
MQPLNHAVRSRRVSRRRAIAATIVAALALALLGPGIAASAGDRPFKGGWLSAETVQDAAPPGCEVFLTTTQAGNATHMGRFTGTGVTCGFDIRVVADPPFNLSGGAPPFLVVDFTVEQTWTAADGSTLTWATPDGVFVQSLSDGSASSMGTMDIMGGSGRFAGATGQAMITAINTDVSFEGAIVYDASN